MFSTVREAARLLECSQRHVRRMIRLGIWPYFRLGKKAIRVDVVGDPRDRAADL